MSCAMTDWKYRFGTEACEELTGARPRKMQPLRLDHQHLVAENRAGLHGKSLLRRSRTSLGSVFGGLLRYLPKKTR